MPTSTYADTEQDLVQRLRGRDEAAMALFYDRYALSLFHVIHRLVRHQAAAEDVLQESMIKIWFAFAQYNPARGRLYTWALNVCKHAAIDHVRVQRSRSQRTDSLHESLEAHLLSAPGFRPEHIGVADWPGQLRPHYQCVLDLLYFGGCTQEEVAEELGLPLGTVKTRARQGLKLLVKRLQAA